MKYKTTTLTLMNTSLISNAGNCFARTNLQLRLVISVYLTEHGFDHIQRHATVGACAPV